MSLDLYLAFLAATTALMLLPGPNVALIVATSVAHGRRFGLATVAGTSAAMVPQLALAVLGMGSVLGGLSHGLTLLRWLGVAYLAYLGIKSWREASRACAPRPAGGAAGTPLLGRLFLRGFLVSLSNPKTLFFYAAFFPQFVSTEGAALPQLVILAVTFLATAVTIDSLWAIMAARLRGLLGRHERLRLRMTGGILMLAGAGLALARHR